MNLKDVRGKLAAKRQELHELYAKHKTEDGINYDASVADAEKFRALNEEINDLGAKEMFLRTDELNSQELKNLQAIDSSVPFGGYTSVASTEAKSLGEVFAQDFIAKGWTMNNPVEVKTNFTAGSSYAPQSLRTGRLVLSAQQAPAVTDLIPHIVNDYAAAKYVRETTFTNNAAETAEAGTIPEAVLAYTEVIVPHAKVAESIPMSREVLRDIDGVQNLINSRLAFMVAQRVDKQILIGDGTGANMTGFLSTSGIQTTARNVAGSEPQADALYRAIIKVNYTGFGNASGIVMNPGDYQTIRLAKTTGSGEYLVAPITEAGKEMVWGLPAVLSTYQTAATVLVGDFVNFSKLYVHQNMEFEVTNSHASEFLTDFYRAKATWRGVLAVERPAAFCTVTSM